MSAKHCPSCHTPKLPVDADEAEAFGLPATMCKCAVKAQRERLAVEGWQIGRFHDTRARLTRLGAPKRFNVSTYATENDNGNRVRRLVFEPYFPAWCEALAGYDMSSGYAREWLPDAGFKLVIARLRSDPELADAVAATFRLGKERAVLDLLFAPMHARNVNEPQDVPEGALSREESRARRRGGP